MPVSFWLWVVGLGVAILGILVSALTKEKGLFWCGMTIQLIGLIHMAYEHQNDSKK